MKKAKLVVELQVTEKDTIKIALCHKAKSN